MIAGDSAIVEVEFNQYMDLLEESETLEQVDTGSTLIVKVRHPALGILIGVNPCSGMPHIVVSRGAYAAYTR